MKLYRSFINSKCMAVTVFTILAISTGLAQAKPASSGSQRYTVINLGNPGWNLRGGRKYQPRRLYRRH